MQKQDSKIHIRAPKTLTAKLAQVAETEQRTPSNMARLLIERGLAYYTPPASHPNSKKENNNV